MHVDYLPERFACKWVRRARRGGIAAFYHSHDGNTFMGVTINVRTRAAKLLKVKL